jgi:hypothetical protein
MILVGPQRLANILRAITQALAAAEALDCTAPRGNTPGNFDRRDVASSSQLATIHASAADLILGEQLASSAGGHPWKTDYILLSELEVPLQLIREASASLLSVGDGPPRLDKPSPSPAIVLGADFSFVKALKGGSAEMIALLRDAEDASRQQWLELIDRGSHE